MFIATIHVEDGPDTCVVRVLKAEGLVDLFAHWIDERFTTHPGKSCREALCFVDPPQWMWRVGLGWRLSLGQLAWRLGQWAHNRDLPLTDVFEVDDIGAVSDWGMTIDDIHAHRNFFRRFDDLTD